MLWSTADPIHLAGRFDINIHLFTLWSCSRPFRTVLATPLLWEGDLFGQVVPDAAVGVT